MVKVALSLDSQNQKIELATARPLTNQAFATPNKVAELAQKVCYVIGCFVGLL